MGYFPKVVLSAAKGIGYGNVLTLCSASLKDNADALVEAIRSNALMENERGDPELLLSQISD